MIVIVTLAVTIRIVVTVTVTVAVTVIASVISSSIRIFWGKGCECLVIHGSFFHYRSVDIFSEYLYASRDINRLHLSPINQLLDVDSNRDRDQEEELVNRALDLRAEGGTTGAGTGTGSGSVGGDAIEVTTCS